MHTPGCPLHVCTCHAAKVGNQSGLEAHVLNASIADRKHTSWWAEAVQCTLVVPLSSSMLPCAWHKRHHLDRMKSETLRRHNFAELHLAVLQLPPLVAAVYPTQ